MKLRMMLVMLALLPFFGMTQISVKGKVMDAQTGATLQGAHLNLNNRLVNTTSDENGSFNISGLKPGTYRLKVTYMGYRTWESLFELNGNKELTITMEPTSIMSEAAIITSTRANEKTPVAYQNLNAEEISKKNHQFPYSWNGFEPDQRYRKRNSIK